eukprot:m.606356 g.606356  ORF g.606356 m.606356 type:complete len:59 (-) comp22470_c0_seq22:1816-1992(-)
MIHMLKFWINYLGNNNTYLSSRTAKSSWGALVLVVHDETNLGHEYVESIVTSSSERKT